MATEMVGREITQPDAWWSAFNEQSDRDGYASVSEWIGSMLVEILDSDLRDELPLRPRRGRPRKTSNRK